MLEEYYKYGEKILNKLNIKVKEIFTKKEICKAKEFNAILSPRKYKYKIIK